MDASTPEDADFKEFFKKEKAEVYLLLDFLSGRSDRSISDQTITIQQPQAGAPDGSVTSKNIPLVSAVSEILLSDQPTVQHEAFETLILARDKLSEIAAPASGSSIAFTMMAAHAQINRRHDDRETNEKTMQYANIAYPLYSKTAHEFARFRERIFISIILTLLITIFSTCLFVYLEQGCFDKKSCLFSRFNYSALSTMLQSHIIPALYGLLGAYAAVVRTIHIKMRDSTLTPRDRAQMKILLVLGAVTGGVIGLFFTGPSPSPGTDLVIGTAGGSNTAGQALSLSALSFLAGLGVENVLGWLEALIKTVFGDPKASLQSAPGKK